MRLHCSRYSKVQDLEPPLNFTYEILFTQELGTEDVAEDLSDSEEESSSQEEDETVDNSAESTSAGSALQYQVLVSDDDSSDEYEDCEDDEEDAWQTCSEDEGGGKVNGIAPKRVERTDGTAVQHAVQEQKRNIKNFSHLVQRNELLEIFKTMHNGPRVKDGEVNVGLVSWTLCLKWNLLNLSFNSIYLPWAMFIL